MDALQTGYDYSVQLGVIDAVPILTLKQQKFVEAYVLTGNASDAARRAGYSEKSARVIAAENLTKPAVSLAIQAQQAIYAAELQITKEDVISGILGAINMAREQGNPAAMIQGCAALAKLCGFYVQHAVEANVSCDTQALKTRYLSMTDDELLAVAAGIRKLS